MAIVAWLAATTVLVGAQPVPPGSEVPRACAAAIDARFAGWQPAPPPALMPEADRKRASTSVVHADFDNDRTRDTAVLLRLDGKQERSFIAVCRSTAGGITLDVIPDPYCRDGIMVVRKGTKAHDFETDRLVTYRTNGIHAYCYEVAGGTYVFDNSRFRLVVDSD